MAVVHLVSILVVLVRLTVHLLHEVAQEANDLVLCLVESFLDVLTNLLEIVCLCVSHLALVVI